MLGHNQKSVLQTLAWFDLFDYPLTREELNRWLWQPLQPSVTQDFSPDHDSIAEYAGFYFLPGREEIVKTRQRKVPLIDKKLKIARRAARKLRWLPFVRAVFAGNTVAAGTARAASDIDVFIVAKRGRLFLSRLFVTLLLTLWRLRRNKKKIADRVCLCFYVTDDGLDLSTIKMGEPDIYLCYWLDQLVPVYDPDNVRSELMKANLWVKKYLPRALFDYHLLPRYRVNDTRTTKLCKRFFEVAWQGAYGDFLEAQAKAVQLTKMKLNRQSAQTAPDSRVVVNDRMLKFHENDRRAEYRERWEKQLKRISNQ